MKKLFKIIGIAGLAIILLYLASIPVLRYKNPIKEAVFFTPTKYDKAKVFNQLDASYLDNVTKDSVLVSAYKFINSKKTDSIKLNHTKIRREFRAFTDNSSSEFYTVSPRTYNKVAIYMLGNTFNVFNIFDQLTELARRDSMRIYIITYNGNGYSGGKPSFQNQFVVNQNFYSYIQSKEKVNYILGHSLCTVFATKLAVDNKIPNLILLAPASNLHDMIAYFKSASNILLRPYFNTTELIKSGTDKLADNSEKIKDYKGNLLLIHGTKDSNLPYSMSEKLLAYCSSGSKKLITVRGGDHYAAFRKQNWENIIGLLSR